MQLLFKWINEHEGWRSTTLKEEKTTIEAFYDFAEAKKRLEDNEIILCGVKIFRSFNGVR